MKIEPVALLPIGAGIIPSIRSTCGVNCITKKEAQQYAPEAVLRLYTETQLNAAVLAEREACAKVCEDCHEWGIAGIIRARGSEK